MKLLVFWVKIEDSYEYCIHEVMNIVDDSLRGLSFKFCVLALAEMLRCCFQNILSRDLATQTQKVTWQSTEGESFKTKQIKTKPTN